jgi:hypothetical protein
MTHVFSSWIMLKSANEYFATFSTNDESESNVHKLGYHMYEQRYVYYHIHIPITQ